MNTGCLSPRQKAAASKAEPVPLADGQTVTYTIHYTNTGSEVATGVTVGALANGGINFGGSNVGNVNLGDIPAGSSGSATLLGTIDAALNGVSAEVDFVVTDDIHHAYDWIWAQHDIDSAPPTDLTVDAPAVYARPGLQRFGGAVKDASGIDFVTVELRRQPSGAVAIFDCVDTTNDGLWSCPYVMGSLAGVDGVEVRARATDRVGNTSDWTAWRALTVDLAPPGVILDSSLDDALADGILGPDELLFSGSLEDESLALAVQLCLTEVDRQTCVWLSTPGGSPTGNWAYDTSGFQSGDWISQTLTIKGLDGAGNFSVPISRTYTVDTVAPVISATQTLEQVNLDDYQPGSPTGAPVLSGTVTDGGGVASISIRLRQPDGSVISQVITPTGMDWEYIPELSMPGDHILTVEATDLAGNVASHAAFTLSVQGGGHFVYLPLLTTK